MNLEDDNPSRKLIFVSDGRNLGNPTEKPKQDIMFSSES